MSTLTGRLHLLATWAGLAGAMDDFEHPFDDFQLLPGVDLYLWLRLVLATLLVGTVVAVALV